MLLYTVVDSDNFYAGDIWIKDGFVHYTHYKSFFIGSNNEQVMEKKRCRLQNLIKHYGLKYILKVVNQNVDITKYECKIGDCEIIKQKIKS